MLIRAAAPEIEDTSFLLQQTPAEDFVIVQLGLIECKERKTMTGLLRVVTEQVILGFEPLPTPCTVGATSQCILPFLAPALPVLGSNCKSTKLLLKM